MQLKEIITEILEKKYSGIPRKMASALDLGEMDIRRAAGIDPGSRRNQEKIFQLVMKIIPLCKEIGIDPARELSSKALAGGLVHESVGKATTNDQRKKKAGGQK